MWWLSLDAIQVIPDSGYSAIFQPRKASRQPDNLSSLLTTSPLQDWFRALTRQPFTGQGSCTGRWDGV
eukprot:m.77543 g.77543  ORF g.77543 m.77543 type:complete len:68 (+) comp50510_c0_seq1:592-795(+)